MARASRNSLPKEEAEGPRQETCVRRGLRELSARSTVVGVAVQSWSITAGVAGRLASLECAVAAVVLKHMQAGLFLVFGPSTRSRWDDDAAQYIRASSLN